METGDLTQRATVMSVDSQLPESALRAIQTGPVMVEMLHTRGSSQSLPAGNRTYGFSLVLPAHNEESRIGPTIERYLPILESTHRPFEIVVVADGFDGTVEVAEQYRERGVRVSRATRKLGKGGAMLAGFRQTRYDIVGYVDADGSLSSSDLAKMIEVISGTECECVIASRWMPESKWIRKEPLQKRIASRGFNLLIRGLLRLNVSDTQCGAKLYRGRLIDQLLSQVVVTNLTTDVGFLFHAQESGARIREVPVTWDNDPRSRFKLGIMVPIMLITVLGIRTMNSSLGKYVPYALVARFQRLLGSI